MYVPSCYFHSPLDGAGSLGPSHRRLADRHSDPYDQKKPPWLGLFNGEVAISSTSQVQAYNGIFCAWIFLLFEFLVLEIDVEKKGGVLIKLVFTEA